MRRGLRKMRRGLGNFVIPKDDVRSKQIKYKSSRDYGGNMKRNLTTKKFREFMEAQQVGNYVPKGFGENILDRTGGKVYGGGGGKRKRRKTRRKSKRTKKTKRRSRRTRR